MEEKINISGLVSRLSLRTGDTKKESEDFTREFVSLIISRLEVGDSVRIRDIGVFKCVEVGQRKSVDVSTGKDVTISAHRKVSFIPSKELAEKVNEPFEMFQTVEIDDAIADRLAGTPISESISTSTESAPDYEPEQPVTEQSVTEQSVTEQVATDSSITTGIAETIDVVNATDSTETLNVTDTPVQSEFPVSIESPVSVDVDNQDTPDSRDETDTSVISSPAEEVKQTEAPSEPAYKYDDDPIYQTVDDKPEAPYGHGESEDPEDLEESQVENPKIHGLKKKVRLNYWLGVATGVVATVLLVIIAYNIYGIHILKENEGIKDLQATMKTIAKEDSLATATAADDTAAVKDSQADASVSAAEVKEPDNSSVNTDGDDAKEKTVATQPSDKKVYDTITTSRYLTTMAKSHYGNYHLWPYIYKENAAFLGHPDRIKPGTKVVIPPLSKYGVNATNPKDIEKAKKLGAGIYSRYQ